MQVSGEVKNKTVLAILTIFTGLEFLLSVLSEVVSSARVHRQPFSFSPQRGTGRAAQRRTERGNEPRSGCPACGSAVRTAGPQRARGNRAHGARPTRGSRGGSAARARSGGRPRTARGEPPEPRALRGPVGPASQNAHVSDARDFLQHPNYFFSRFKNWCFSLSKPLSRLPSGSRPHSKGPARTAAPHASPWGSLGTGDRRAWQGRAGCRGRPQRGQGSARAACPPSGDTSANCSKPS